MGPAWSTIRNGNRTHPIGACSINRWLDVEFDALTFLSNNNNEFPCPQHPLRRQRSKPRRSGRSPSREQTAREKRRIMRVEVRWRSGSRIEYLPPLPFSTHTSLRPRHFDSHSHHLSSPDTCVNWPVSRTHLPVAIDFAHFWDTHGDSGWRTRTKKNRFTVYPKAAFLGELRSRWWYYSLLDGDAHFLILPIYSVQDIWKWVLGCLAISGEF